MLQERWPDFLIVGAAKSGTTSLWRILGVHENVFMTREIQDKELGFFCDDYGLTNEVEYLNKFQGASPSQLIGEACHAYLSSPESAHLIYKKRPDCKIIIILRNPVDRAYSLYNWMVQHGYEHLSFEKSITREEVVLRDRSCVSTRYHHSYWRNYLYVTTGFYAAQVERYLQVFTKANVLVLLSDDFSVDAANTANEVASFLGLRPFARDTLQFANENQSLRVSSPRMHFFCYRVIRRFRKSRMSRVLSPIAEFLLRVNTSNRKPKPMSEILQSKLCRLYEPDIRKLERLVNKDLSRWLVR